MPVTAVAVASVTATAAAAAATVADVAAAAAKPLPRMIQCVTVGASQTYFQYCHLLCLSFVSFIMLIASIIPTISYCSSQQAALKIIPLPGSRLSKTRAGFAEGVKVLPRGPHSRD